MSSLPWIVFVLLVLLLLGLDLGLLNRRPHAITARQALRWTAFWVAIAMLFNVALACMYEYGWFGVGTLYGTRLSGEQAGLQFFTAYVVEESLSVDNLFVMALVFRSFSVPERYQHRVLFLGILGALIFRATFILAGLALIQAVHWTVYVFGALLVYTAVRMLFAKDDAPELQDNIVLKLARRILPITHEYHGEKLLVRLNGKNHATPLMLALVVIETSDVIFAVDSVPAVLGVTQDPFIAFTSNVFAILGLRSLYFALAAVLSSFHYLKVSLVMVLGFVGAKMLLTHHLPIGSAVSLFVIIGFLFGGVLASIIAKRRAEAHAPQPTPSTERAPEELH
ncbi:MAG TPA: TerC family protein [Polyangiales bacterium]|nr:TerC family protein [Polyangiales bacterium]